MVENLVLRVRGERGDPLGLKERGVERGLQGMHGERGERGLPGSRGQKGERGPEGQSVGGVVFTIWGRKNCPSTSGTQQLYEGTTAGSRANEGGSAEYLCLHQQPQFLSTVSGLQDVRGRLYATEYDFINSPALSHKNRHDAPCAVCYVPMRNAMVTIPARISCPSSWTREYYGYLMADKYHAHHKSRTPICVDKNADSVAGSSHPHIDSLLMFMETTCNGTRCPPYFNGAEVTCVVCTK